MWSKRTWADLCPVRLYKLSQAKLAQKNTLKDIQSFADKKGEKY